MTNVHTICIALLILLVQAVANTKAIDPKFDPSTRMRLVMVPADATVGSVIYRLRATDEEFDYPLQFELVGDAASSTVLIESLPCTKYNSVCQANVILTRRLESGRFYDFQVSVKDTKGGMAQQGCSITATNFTTPHDLIFPHKTGIIMIPEDAKRGTELDYVISRKNPLFAKSVYLELWGSPLFAIRQKIASTETTEGTIFLLGPLDFETQSMYHLTVLANDAYAEPGQDSRNIAGLEVVVIVQDVQDVPPIFIAAPPVTRLPSGLLPGDKVLQVHAEDGDKGNPREIRYGLVSEGNPFTSFFDINDTSGEIFLVRPLDEISAITHIGDPVLLTVIAEEVKVLKDEPAAMATTVQLAFFLPERSNSPPYFENDHYVARIDENSPQGTALLFADPYVSRVYDDDTGKNGVFSLTLLGNNGTFEISPNVAERRASFLIRVRDNGLLDYETRHSVQFQVLAQELGPATNLSAIVNVTVYINDVNDNLPVFDEEAYIVDIPENITAGTRVIQVHATDVDTGIGGRVRYNQILGYLNTSLNLDPVTGVIMVTTDKHGFDRESMPEYHLYVEARDMDGMGKAAQVPLIIKMIDVNDNAPIFEKSLYEFILAPNLREFTSPAILRAIDLDAEEPNNIVRYELINGNYENKFSLDKTTGHLTLREPLMLRPKVMHRHRRQSIDTNAAEAEVFVLTARAYDLGVPVMFSMSTIRIYPPESKARTVMFIVAGDNPDIRKTEDSLSAITGGRVIIHSVKPYTGNEPGPTNIGGDSRNKSVVVATVLYDSSSFVDISEIQQRISNNSSSSVIDVTARSDSADTVYRAENRFLFWLLILLALIIALAILTLLFCCICSWCPLYAGARKKVIRVNSTEDDVHLVHRELGFGKQTKSVQVAEWMGRREAWSAQKSTDSRTKPTQWEFSRRVNHRQEFRHNHANEHELDKRVRSADDHRSINLRNNNKIAKETQFHNSTTNLINERDVHVEEVLGDDTNDEDHEFVDELKGKQSRAADQYPMRQYRNENLKQTEEDSMRRHEIDRGSDIEYDKSSMRKRQADNEVVHAEDDGSDREDGGGRIDNRDQLYIKEGNTEILRLVTRGKNEGIYVNVPSAMPQPQYIMVENGGKEILMRRFIEEQTNGKQIIREHYQILPGVHQQHNHQQQPMPNEVQQHPLSLNVNDLYTTKSSQIGSAIYSHDAEPNNQELKLTQMLHRGDQQENTQMKNADSTHSLVQQELENSLKQQNALLRQILLEKEKMVEKYSQHETAMETQSLPGHSLAIATQTDCDAGTQTEPYSMRPPPRRARSENDDSMSDDEDIEYVRYSPTNSSNGVYWLKRIRHKRSNKKNTSISKPRRRIVMVEEMKRKIRTPIKEESEDQPVQTPPRRPVVETRTSVMRRKRVSGHSGVTRNPDGVLKKEVLIEISDSLDDERVSPKADERRLNRGLYKKQIEYYIESDDESDADIVIGRNMYSADSLDDNSDIEDELATPHRSKSRISKQTPRHGSSNETLDIHYSKNKTPNSRQRSESVTSIPIMRPRLSRKEVSNAKVKQKSRRKTASESPHRSGKGSAPRPPAPLQNKPIAVRQKAQSEADIDHKLSDESHALSSKSVPKYMEWYYNKNTASNSEKRLENSIAGVIVGGGKKLISGVETRTKTKDSRRAEGIKVKPEPLPRITSYAKSSSNDGQQLLREDVQMNKNLAPKIETGTNHPLLQYSEHRYEHEYDPAPEIPIAPTILPHHMYPETQPQVVNMQKFRKQQHLPKPSPIREHEVKDFKVIIPINVTDSQQCPKASAATKQLSVATLEDDHDSGIAMNSLLHNVGRRNPIADKKSVFTIAYDDVRVKRIPSESDSPQFS